MIPELAQYVARSTDGRVTLLCLSLPPRATGIYSDHLTAWCPVLALVELVFRSPSPASDPGVSVLSEIAGELR